ncbi:MAG: hypothetical protein K2P51_05060 [Rhabdochlamydiaceae bacterium]|nr:hypothetical protein [Rhabdochlamydiaceae bacterium]
MAGNQVSKGNGSTYYREYKAFGGTDELRQKIFVEMQSSIKGKGIKKIGDHYSFTPYRLRDGRNIGTLPTTWQGGGFFLTLKKLSEEDKRMSSLEYITRTLGPQLESISDLTVEELVKQFHAYGQYYLLEYFFEPIDLPQEGDLVIYQGTEDSRPHYGIFRESRRNWNSPCGGTVESKWEWWSSPYVFQHDVFFVPPTYGNVAKFYRVKSEKVDIDTLAIKPHPMNDYVPSVPSLNSNTIYNVEEDGSLTFNRTKMNVERRKIIDEYTGIILNRKLPEIKHLSYIKFFGVCHQYAFGRALSTYPICPDMPEHKIYGGEILKKYFTVTTSPQKGDLVVYYDSISIKHWGIYLGDDRVESKWGLGSVYRHHLIDAPSEYSDTIRCFRLKDGLTVKSLTANLKQDNQRI